MQAVCLCVCACVCRRKADKTADHLAVQPVTHKGLRGHVVGATVNESSEAVCPLARAGRQAAEQPATW